MLVLVAALVLFGPKRLPELGKSLGKGVREFRRGTQGLKEELEQSLSEPTAPTKSEPEAPRVLRAEEVAVRPPEDKS